MEPLGLSFGEQNARGSAVARGDFFGVGYTGFEVVGGYDQVTCEGELVVVKKQKPSCWGSILANETPGGGFVFG
jgi:hypothetical protein